MPGHRILKRYLQADAISDIPRNMFSWKKVVETYSELETELPLLLARIDPSQPKSRDDLRKEYACTTAPERYYRDAMTVGLGSMFLAILQQYDLESKDQKAIEKLAQFYSKRSARKFQDFSVAAKKLPELILTINTQLQITQDVLSRSKPRGTESDGHKVVDAGPFRVVNTGNFSVEVMTIAGKVAQEAARRLSSKGLGKVCYGDILVSNRLNRKKEILAFYLPGKDEMFIRADLKGHEHDALDTLVHELGHRLYAKFLGGHQRSLVHTMYRRIQDGHNGSKREAIQDLLNDPSTKPKAGDVLVDPKKNVELMVTNLSFDYKGEGKVHLTFKDDPKSVGQTSISLEGWYQHKGIKLDLAKVGGFVSHYASTDPEENFAEMVSAYCMGKLHPSQVEMLEEIIK